PADDHRVRSASSEDFCQGARAGKSLSFRSADGLYILYQVRSVRFRIFLSASGPLAETYHLSQRSLELRQLVMPGLSQGRSAVQIFDCFVRPGLKERFKYFGVAEVDRCRVHQRSETVVIH